MINNIFVQDFNGNKIDLLSKYKNEALLLLFYNNQCLGCTGRAIPLANKLQKQFKNIKVIGIHSNFGNNNITEKDIKSIFTIDYLPFPIYVDVNHKVYDKFKCEGTPHWIVISKDLKLSHSIFGSQTGAQNRLLYALEELKP